MAYQLGRVPLPGWVYEEVPMVSWASLHNWERRLKNGGVTALAHKKFTKECPMDAEQREFAIQLLLSHTHLGPKNIWHELLNRYPEKPLSYSVVTRFLSNWRDQHAATYAYADSLKDWRSKHMRAFGSYKAGHYNERWEIDSTLSDLVWELKDDLGGFRRYALVVAVEVYSRRAKVLVAQTSNSLAIASLTRECLLDWGVPENIKTDNGKDYLSQHYLNLLAALEIKHQKCTPFSPHQKPYVERFNRTFVHGHDFLLHPKYLGHDVATRTKIRARDLWKETPRRYADNELQVQRVNKSLREFQAFVDLSLDKYNHTPHTGLPKIPDPETGTWRHQTPNERAEGQERKVIGNLRALDVLLMPAADGGWRSLRRKEGVQIGKLENGLPAYYFSAELLLVAESRERAFVRLDAVPGVAHLFSDEICSEYLCEVQCYEITGGKVWSEITKTRMVEASQRKAVATARKAMRQNLRGDQGEVQRGEVVQLRPGQQGNVHVTPALAAADQAGETYVKPMFPSLPEQMPQTNPAAIRFVYEDIWPRVLDAWAAGKSEECDSEEVAFMGRMIGMKGGDIWLLEDEAVARGIDWWDFCQWCHAAERARKEKEVMVG